MRVACSLPLYDTTKNFWYVCGFRLRTNNAIGMHTQDIVGLGGGGGYILTFDLSSFAA